MNIRAILASVRNNVGGYLVRITSSLEDAENFGTALNPKKERYTIVGPQNGLLISSCLYHHPHLRLLMSVKTFMYPEHPNDVSGVSSPTIKVEQACLLKIPIHRSESYLTGTIASFTSGFKFSVHS
jgi:hypothetical protein